MGGGEEKDVLPRQLPCNPTWIKDIPKRLHNVPLNKLAIPGSHDAFAFYLDKTGPIAPSESSVLADLAKLLGPGLKDIVYNWSVTQSLSVSQQLEAGIRYFDIRACTRTGTEDVYIVHGLYGMPVLPLLEEISGWLNEHRWEVVILDFKGLYCMTREDHLRFMGMIAQVFHDKLCPFLDAGSATLDTLWENSLQVLAFYENPIAKENFQFWPVDYMISPWPNVTDVDKLLSCLEKAYDKSPPPDDKFYVTQGVLTPDVPYILGHLSDTIKDNLCSKVARPMVDWLKGKKPRGHSQKGINICILDYVEMSDYINSVIQLNNKIE